MRTLVIVGALVVLVLACGASFVVRAEGAAPATLDHQCTPPVLPAGVDTLVTCTFTATNTGTTPIVGAQVTFQASSGRLPDAYYFLAAGAKGVPDAPVAEGQLDYPIGDLAPGEPVTLSVQVIVRSTEPYTADAVLLGDDGHEYARVALGGRVEPASSPDVRMKFVFVGEASGQPPGAFTLYIMNLSDAPIDGGKLRLYFGENAVLATDDGWQATGPGQAVRLIDQPLAPGDTYTQSITFTAGAQPCPYVHPAAVLITGAEETFAAIADGSASLGACGGQGGGGPAPTADELGSSAKGLAFPATGSGAGNDTRIPAPLLMLVVGALVLAAGFSVRRTR